MVALLVVSMIIICLVIDYFVKRSQQRAIAAEPAKPAFAHKLALPGGYFLSKAHTYAQLLFSGKVRVGIDEFIANLIGTADSIEVVAIGSSVRKGEILFSLQQGDRTLHFRAPISGKIVSINELIAEDKARLAADPYMGGWVVAIEPKNLAAEVGTLSLAEEAADWLKNELNRFRDFLTAANTQPAYATMLDGGMPAKGALQHLDAATWDKFEKEFLAK
jgi:glycine cleavage system H protein